MMTIDRDNNIFELTHEILANNAEILGKETREYILNNVDDVIALVTAWQNGVSNKVLAKAMKGDENSIKMFVFALRETAMTHRELVNTAELEELCTDNVKVGEQYLKFSRGKLEERMLETFISHMEKAGLATKKEAKTMKAQMANISEIYKREFGYPAREDHYRAIMTDSVSEELLKKIYKEIRKGL